MATIAPSRHRSEVTEMLAENDRRKRVIFGNHNQVTGKGMEGHTHKCVIPDYELPEQWLTDEVWNNELYRIVLKCGGIARYREFFALTHGMEVTHEDVTKQLMVARLCGDPSFSFAMEYKVKSKRTGRMVPFILNYAQRVTLARLEEMRLAGEPIRLIILKARQWGGSTLVDLYISWIQLHVMTGWYAIIIAQTKDTAHRIRAMYEKALEQMPAFIYGCRRMKFAPYRQSGSDSVIVDEKGHQIIDNVITTASYENADTSRGLDYAMAHFSEVAYWRTTPNRTASQVITNLDNNIGLEANTLEVFESTANGQSGYFYDEYQLAKKGLSIRKAIFIPFYFIENDMLAFASRSEMRDFCCRLIDHKDEESAPDETSEPGQYLWSLWHKGATLEHIKWYIMKRRSFHDHGSMAQEVPSDDIECFVYSGHNVFNPYLLALRREAYQYAPDETGDIVRNTRGEPRFKAGPNGRLKMWRRPAALRVENQYIVCVDLGGRSPKSDYSVITVIDRLPKLVKGGKLEVVARWRGHLRYDAVARMAVLVARFYNDALLVIESNSYDRKKADAGQFVETGDHIRGALAVIGDSYQNLYVRAATSEEDIKAGIYTKIGFQTNVRTKQDMVDWFVPLFEDDEFIDHDEVFYDEAAIYEEKEGGGYGNKPGDGNHDDVIMTDMIACLVDKDMPLPVLRRTEAAVTRKGTHNESEL